MGLRIEQRQLNMMAMAAPMLYCDHCGQRMTDASRLGVLWLTEHPDMLYYLHQGECTERFIAERGAPFLCIPGVWFVVLLNNNLFTPEQNAQIGKLLSESFPIGGSEG